mmetsp:Transcript_7587/g.22193  ORF Transcript_7587/g.22193 Transcript_7587/m.22193 type:complete len:302 (-) Transcript_7587:494-1399(-)
MAHGRHRSLGRSGPLSVEFKILVVLLGVGLVSLLEILGQDDIAVGADRVHARLLHDAGDLRAGELLWPRDVVLEVHVVREVHLGSQHLKDKSLLAASGLRELDFAVEAPGPQEGGVEGVGAVRGHDHLDVHRLVEAVHLVEKLEEDPLHLAVRPRLRVEALRGDGVHLVDEDDGRGVLSREAEDVAHHARALAQVLLHKLGSNDADEARRRVVCDRLCEHRLARARGAIEQHAARGVDADLLVELKVRQWQLHRLPHLLLLDVRAADVIVRHVRHLVSRHHGDGRVRLRREHVDDCVGVPM